jgi:regulator of nonsense transcripts 1
MEDAFTHLGNHLISESASAISANGADELSNIDPEESFGTRRGATGDARRRHDDEDNQTEVFDDDDAESLASAAVDGMKALRLEDPDDDPELPAHACA